MPETYAEYETHLRRGGSIALAAAGAFFTGDDPVHRTLRDVAKRLDGSGIPYAICGGMALVAHGYQRTTTHVDVLVTREGLAAAHAALDGRGMSRRSPAARTSATTRRRSASRFW